MRSAIAFGWLLIALLGFVSGNLLNLGVDDPLARVGAALYAVLLTISIVWLVLNALARQEVRS